jgi:DNA-binding NtrC family response regulator
MCGAAGLDRTLLVVPKQRILAVPDVPEEGMTKPVVLLEDDADLAALVIELLSDSEYLVYHVQDVDALLMEAARRSPCVALIDSTNPKTFDLWWIGPKLARMGVPPVAFTAHGSARTEFEADAHGYAGVVAKPFDADEFLNVVDTICWEDHQAAAG